MSKHSERAIELFNSGCNCAQAAFSVFAEEAGLDETICVKIAAPFGGGIGGSRNVCGALTGALMACGALNGYTSGVTPEEKKAYNRDIAEIMEKFAAKTGSIICGELLAFNETDLANGILPPDVKACNRYVEHAVQLVEEYLAQKKSGQAD